VRTKSSIYSFLFNSSVISLGPYPIFLILHKKIKNKKLMNITTSDSKNIVRMRLYFLLLNLSK
jgi:hypothetical protein